MNVVSKSIKHVAPGPYLGFALQPVRLCYHLLKCKTGESASLEYLDDVAIHHLDGSITLEQTKSALSQNPLTNWSEDFWKTLANWLDFHTAHIGTFSKINYRLYVTPVKNIGNIPKELHDANSSIAVTKAVKSIQKKQSKLSSASACEHYLQKLFSAPPEVLLEIISRFEILNSEQDPIDPLRELLKPTVSAEMIDVLCGAAIGLAKQRIDHLIRNKQTPIINGDDFKNAFVNFVQKNNLPHLLVSFASQPDENTVAAILKKRPTFIRQLEIIGLESEDHVRAISDFLRSSADKTKWAEAGRVYEESLRDWDTDLINRHSLIDGEVNDVYAEKDKETRGRVIYRRCMQLQLPLDGRAVPSHFVPGCFNSLADVKKLGWHSDYKTLLPDDD